MTQEDIIEDLREQVAYWKSEALGVRDAGRRAKMQAFYRISRSQAELLDALYAKRGGLLTKVHAEDAVTGHGDERSSNTVDVQICRLRKRIGADSVQTVWGRGWHLSDEAVKTLDRITGINS